jgi:hypothetical protein
MLSIIAKKLQAIRSIHPLRLQKKPLNQYNPLILAKLLQVINVLVDNRILYLFF